MSWAELAVEMVESDLEQARRMPQVHQLEHSAADAVAS